MKAMCHSIFLTRPDNRPIAVVKGFDVDMVLSNICRPGDPKLRQPQYDWARNLRQWVEWGKSVCADGHKEGGVENSVCQGGVITARGRNQGVKPIRNTRRYTE